MLVESLMYAMKWSDILHVVGVVSGYIANPSKVVKYCFGILEARISPIVVVVIYSVVMLIHCLHEI